jgi:hypothetical protein
MAHYDKQFYDEIRETSRHAARTIAPMVLDLVGPISSVVDIGCGNAIWLSVWRELGATRTLGIDGEHVDRSMLEIPADDFIAMDLSRPLPALERHDLAMTLEVVEHLQPERAESIVEELIALAPVVLFSAATPGQLGDGHINLEWQDVWAERFERRGYRTIDAIRSRVWRDLSISWWYQQNVLIFASAEALAANPKLRERADATDRERISVIHPRQYMLLFELTRKAYRERAALSNEVATLRQRIAAFTDNDESD